MPQPKKSNLKLPPQNLEAEQAVLGSILIDKNAIFRVADILAPQDFYSPVHEKIYEGIMVLYEKRQPIDVMTLANWLRENDQLTNIGGSTYLAELTNQVTTASHVEHYAGIVKEKKVRRDLIKASAEITEQAFDPMEIEDILDDIEQKILSISQKTMPQNFTAVSEELRTAIERINKMRDSGTMRGIPTGFPALDNKLSGLQKSDLVILGARPSAGKTSLALDIARQAALGGASVGIFSLEMAREQVIDRIISAESQVPLWNILTGKIQSDMDTQMILQSIDKLSNMKLFIDDSPSLTVLQMRSMARRLQVEHGLDLLVVDYLQLVKPRTNSDNVVQQITEVSRGMKALARELKVPVLVLSQLSRGVEQRDHKEPRLSDLRDSGSIEQDADVVLFIYRENAEMDANGNNSQGIRKIRIAKHRNGAIGEVELMFDGERASFKSIDKRYETSSMPSL
jgi:replicative DNA helicase